VYGLLCVVAVVVLGTGLMPSFALLLGGVGRLPWLAKELGTGEGKVDITVPNGYFWCPCWRGGGGSSKFGRFDAFGLRAVKLGGPPCPIESGPGCMWGG